MVGRSPRSRRPPLAGSCWAFATVATIEGLHKIKTGKLVSLSEQELVDCASPPNHGCDGGNPALGLAWVADNGGLTTESDYPYGGRQGGCKLDKMRNHVAKISDVGLVDPDDEAALEAAVARQPVAVVINAEPNIQHYTGGVFHGPCDPEKIDHAVTVVGYGAEPGGGRKYWIVRNSWGGKWGEKGYFRLERRVKDKRGMCGVATFPSFPVM
jgi:C1A family cysteine protease